MISVVRSPLRISFCGGGTDFPKYFNKYGTGKVISSAINKYIYALYHRTDNKLYVINNGAYEEKALFTVNTAKSPDDINNIFLRECVKEYDISGGCSLSVWSDLPFGIGLGGSSVTCAALVALLNEKIHEKQAVAETAFEFETQKLKRVVGKQDHYASVYGGMNIIEFSKRGVTVNPVPEHVAEWIKDKIMLYKPKESKTTNNVHEKMISQLRDKEKYLNETVSLVDAFSIALLDADIHRIADIFNKQWELKKITHNVTTDNLDNIGNEFLRAGALAYKFTGSLDNNVGCILIITNNKDALRNNIKTDYEEILFDFDYIGTWKILL